MTQTFVELLICLCHVISLNTAHNLDYVQQTSHSIFSVLSKIMKYVKDQKKNSTEYSYSIYGPLVNGP